MSVQILNRSVVRSRFMNAPFDRIWGDRVLELLAERDRPEAFRYVVTPNVDHVVRLNRDASLKDVYDAAWLSICDSKPITLLARLLGVGVTYLPGSNLTDSMFARLLADGAKIALVAGSEEIATAVAAAYPKLEVAWCSPPPGTAGNAEAMKACVNFVATSDADFIFIAIGAPTSERIAHAASMDPRSRGVALCVGAALEFLVGKRRRAPRWMQAVGLEWLFRLGAEPKRLWRRYVFGAAPLARLFVSEIRSRRLTHTGSASLEG